MDIKFTDLEVLVLRDLLKSWDGNGGDFGFTEGVESVDGSRARGVLSSLVKKGVIHIWDPVTTDSGTFHQFDFCGPDEGRELGEKVRGLVG
jgi:hypothetical protein